MPLTTFIVNLLLWRKWNLFIDIYCIQIATFRVFCAVRRGLILICAVNFLMSEPLRAGTSDPDNFWIIYHLQNFQKSHETRMCNHPHTQEKKLFETQCSTFQYSISDERMFLISLSISSGVFLSKQKHCD